MSATNPPNAPLRAVTSSSVRAGAVGFLGAQRFTSRWWDLTLICGHHAERTVRYRYPDGAKLRGFARLHAGPPPMSQALPAPRRVRCDACRAAQAQLPAP